MRIYHEISMNQFRIADCGLRIVPRHAIRIRNPKSEIRNRRGAVAVEFAFVAPILLAIVMGMIELGRAFEMQNLLEVAAREGARFASMDRDGMLEPGQSANDKLIEDVKNFLATNDVPRDDITVHVRDYENPTAEFDLDDPENDLRLFEVSIEVPWSSMSLTSVGPGYVCNACPLIARVVFRNGRATISN